LESYLNSIVMKKIFNFTLFAFLFSQNIFAQCAMCKASAETSMEASTQAAGVNNGVLYVMFFVGVALSFFLYIFLKGRKADSSK